MTAEVDDAWRRLSIRVVWVDIVVSLLSLLPAGVAIFVVGVEQTNVWPFLVVAVWGVAGAGADMVRWLCTSYRITATEVERRTGILVRRHRAVRRDRIRSVDTHARLRHRVAGLRVVTIGAGQQTSAGEAAFVLDALSRADARHLGVVLLGPGRDSVVEAGTPAGTADGDVMATLRPWWIVYNMFSIWAYLTAAGLLWGAFWLASSFGVDLLDLSTRFVDWGALGWLGTTVVALIGGGALGALGMGISFIATNWGFELSRVSSREGSHLRTRRGLFSTREVNRDEARVRGLSLSEPLVWRWMRMADTTIITTGLGIWDVSEPTALLPRGPRAVALEVAERVLGEPSPLTAPLRRHPAAGLRRRLWWATLLVAAVLACLAVPVAAGAAPVWLVWGAVGLWPLALVCAVVAHRALGHAIVGDHVVVRSGLVSRVTSALRCDAVSTVAIRQSVLQQRLGLATVSFMTAAGWGTYEAPDVAADSAVALAGRASHGLLSGFVEDAPATARS